jgi:hypothetical protein
MACTMQEYRVYMQENLYFDSNILAHCQQCENINCQPAALALLQIL